jgi:hypothetical protein
MSNVILMLCVSVLIVSGVSLSVAARAAIMPQSFLPELLDGPLIWVNKFLLTV